MTILAELSFGALFPKWQEREKMRMVHFFASIADQEGERSVIVSFETSVKDVSTQRQRANG